MAAIVNKILICTGFIFMLMVAGSCKFGNLDGQVQDLNVSKSKEAAGKASEEEKSGPETETKPESGLEAGAEPEPKPKAEAETGKRIKPREDEEKSKEEVELEKKEEKNNKRLWSILIYMSGDNNLEASAIEDFVEMEKSRLNTDEISVLVLLDRNPAYDTSNMNWSGTKFFELQTGRDKSQKQFISRQIECETLGLSSNETTELDMSSAYVLRTALEFVYEEYPAEDYGLIIWGHGTGWRGFSYDETSKTYMTLNQLEKAVSGVIPDSKLNFIGFDSCFGPTFEVLYQLKNCADYVMGSEGLLMSAGWNYTDLFNAFETLENKSALELCKASVGQFKSWYEKSMESKFCLIQMEGMTAYSNAFEDFMEKASAYINSRRIRDDLMELIYSDMSSKVVQFSYGSAGSDIYLDVSSLADCLYGYFQDLKYRNELYPIYKNFKDVSEKTIICDTGGISVYFSTLTVGNHLAVTHPKAYINGSEINQVEFVKNIKSYVPGVKDNNSFLGKLFYEKF